MWRLLQVILLVFQIDQNMTSLESLRNYVSMERCLQVWPACVCVCMSHWLPRPRLRQPEGSEHHL